MFSLDRHCLTKHLKFSFPFFTQSDSSIHIFAASTRVFDALSHFGILSTKAPIDCSIDCTRVSSCSKSRQLSIIVFKRTSLIPLAYHSWCNDAASSHQSILAPTAPAGVLLVFPPILQFFFASSLSQVSFVHMYVLVLLPCCPLLWYLGPLAAELALLLLTVIFSDPPLFCHIASVVALQVSSRMVWHHHFWIPWTGHHWVLE